MREHKVAQLKTRCTWGRLSIHGTKGHTCPLCTSSGTPVLSEPQPKARVLRVFAKGIWWATLLLPRMLWSWIVDAWTYLTGPTGYRVVITVLVTAVGAYFGMFAIFEGRYERRLNRATFERATFITMVSSDNQGAFIAAMKDFGPIQTRKVPFEPLALTWPKSCRGILWDVCHF